MYLHILLVFSLQQSKVVCIESDAVNSGKEPINHILRYSHMHSLGPALVK